MAYMYGNFKQMGAIHTRKPNPDILVQRDHIIAKLKTVLPNGNVIDDPTSAQTIRNKCADFLSSRAFGYGLARDERASLCCP